MIKKKNLKISITVILFFFIFINLTGCINDNNSNNLIGTWQLVDAPEIVMILNEDGTTNVWNDPQLAERVGNNYTSQWTVTEDGWIFFNYNFTTYEKNFKFQYRFENNYLIFIDLAYEIEFPFKRI